MIGASEDRSVVAIGPAAFRHHDRVAGVAIDGVALTADAWRAALAPALAARVEPLGDLEHQIVATPV